MSQSYFKNHPMYRKSLIEKRGAADYVFLKFQDEIWHLFQDKAKDIRILEIWLWNGDFANFCQKNKFSNYVWVDIDDAYISQLKDAYSSYTFLVSDIVDFLKSNTDRYDIVFMSHVFEHLPRDTAHESIQLIYSQLNTGWYWINYMPNADSAKACALRYIDITHQSIYNTNSFEQILYTNWANFSEITHHNTLPAISPHVKRVFKLIHPIFWIATKIYYYGMWLTFPRIYTSEILSIMKK